MKHPAKTRAATGGNPAMARRARRLVIGLYPDTETTELVDAWLESHPQAPAALRRIVLEQRDHQQRAIRVRELQGARVG